MAGKLTAVGVRALVKPGRYTDGEGLHLYVKAADRRAWVLRYTRSGKSRDMGLGAYPAITLVEARERASDARKHLRAGNDPLAARETAQGKKIATQQQTFRRAAEELMADKGRA